jgi:hypothetical protein
MGIGNPLGAAPGPGQPAQPAPQVQTPQMMAQPNMPVYSLGTIQGVTLGKTLEMERERQAAANDQVQASPLITGIAALIKNKFMTAWTARINTVDDRMLQNLRARQGKYDPERLSEISKFGGSDIYVGITGIKCRSAGSWIRDVMLGQGDEKPWSVDPVDDPDVSPEVTNDIVQKTQSILETLIQNGQPPSQDTSDQLMRNIKDMAMNQIRSEARKAANRMEAKMETQLLEGGWLEALDAFVDDLTTFPSAVLKGPIVRNKNRLQWVKGQDGNYTPDIQKTFVLEWDRVDPFNIYPSPAAVTPNDGYLIERHQLSRQDLNDLIGVAGYNDTAIKAVLEQYGQNGLRAWLTNDVAYAAAKGQSTMQIANNTDDLIDALQYWGSIMGQDLLDWGMEAKDVPDPTQEYDVEAWLIGDQVIKAVLNPDPMHRRPYYKASYENVPGSFWGRSVADIVRDVQIVCNAAARSLVNNMAMASGPQVVVDVSMLADGEDLSQITPWRIWQISGNSYGDGVRNPITFFQPQSNVQELAAIYNQFSNLADEYSGVPRFMTGDSAGGAGRTASGLSMLMGNAGKAIKQVIANIDNSLIKPVIERLYIYNMRYSDDPDLKGAASITAHGADSMIAKENAQMRRTEFLAATANPIDMSIVGVTGRAAVLRETVKTLDMDADQVVPPDEVLTQKLAAEAAAQQQAAQPPGPGGPGGPGTPGTPGASPAPPPGPNGMPVGGGAPGIPGSVPPAANPATNQQVLATGHNITDHFSPHKV